MKNKLNKIHAFTLVELIIVITILTILSTIRAVSFTGYIVTSRDTKRVTDLENFKMLLKSEKQKYSIYPMPGNYFTIINSGANFAYQGYMDDSVKLSNGNEIAKDPKINKAYLYSITTNLQYFQIAATLESGNNLNYKSANFTNTDNNVADVTGDFRPLFVNNTPSIILANTANATSIDVTGTGTTADRLKFILNGGAYNLPYNIDTGNYFVSNPPTSFTGLLLDPNVKILSNNEFNSCRSIYNGGRFLGNGYYSLALSGSLQNMSCIFNSGLQTDPGLSCNNILSQIDGIYWIKPDANPAFQVYCDMTNDGGGWTLVHKTTNSAIDLTGDLTTTEGNRDWITDGEYRLSINYWKYLSSEKAMAKNIRVDNLEWNDIEPGIINSISTSSISFSLPDTYYIFNGAVPSYSQNSCTSGTNYWNSGCCIRCVNYDAASTFGATNDSPMISISATSYLGSAIEGAGGTNDADRHRLSKMGIFLK